MAQKIHHDQDPREYQYFQRTEHRSNLPFWAIIIALVILITVFYIEFIINNNQNQILEEKYYESTDGSSNERNVTEHCWTHGYVCLSRNRFSA